MKVCPACQVTYPSNFAVCPQDGSVLQELDLWAEGSVILDKYRIVGKVGQGGMGAVYKAIHLAFDEMRALKVISQELMSDELFVKRFKHEAVITRRLQHPNAVRVDDIDEAEDGRPFIVMEYIEGRSLKKLIHEEGPMPVPRACFIIKQVCRALEAAHRLGMIHRDIKPDNIALIDTPEGEVAKVLDFGIAKVKESRGGDAGMTMTGAGVVIGTPQYMSPEQAMGKRGDELDGRSDLYSLGMVMYQMLTGDLPFKAETTMEMLLAHLQKQPTPIRELRPDLQIPDSIAQVVMRTLEKDPEMRPASAKALIEEIERAEKPAAPLRGTKIMQASDFFPSEEAPPPQPEVAAGPPAARVAPAPRPAPAAPRPAAPVSQPRVAAPAAKPSQWGLWVALGVLAIGVGGGGWFFLVRRPAPSSEAPIVTPGETTTGTVPSTTPSSQPAVTPASTETSPPATTPSEKTVTEPSQPPTRPVTAPPVSPPTSVARPSLNAGDMQKIKEHVAMAQFHFERGEYAAAIEEAQGGLRLDPNNAQLRSLAVRAQKAKAAEEKYLQ
jgi:serine/threonine-protein kinase